MTDRSLTKPSPANSTLQDARRTVEIERDGLDALARALAEGSDLSEALIATVAAVRNAPGRVVVSGMGKSGHVARKIAATMASTGTPAMFVHPAEASHGDLGMIGTGDLVMALSNSGETRELSDIVNYCARFDIPLVAITSVALSSLANAADHLLLLPAADEACSVTRAPTTSTTLMMALGDALAVALLRDRGFDRDDFKTYHPGGKLGAAFQRVSDVMTTGAMPLTTGDVSVRELVAIITHGGVGTAGIMREGQLVGVVTDGDLRRNIGRDLLQLTAQDIMTHDPVTVEMDTLAADALGLLNRKLIQVLFVVKDGAPVGLLHIHDFLKEGVA
ncbi:arabinose-5-phosphate isomerase [Algimonas arctica]|uniref:Arabinose-5-phosphate isomerase n=1 Tax=Algimonas arctica TaxID=1479486 RepID=A0A8J3G1J7_9PROT|nr:KpsF/GutQ family sugar-phosphate isomerase [Algimonas arctica]GHA88773.1 arabinose-5-phosphate isomerase [Algimonas arctica]